MTNTDRKDRKLRDCFVSSGIAIAFRNFTQVHRNEKKGSYHSRVFNGIVSNINHIAFYSLYIYNRLNAILEFPRIVQKEIMNRKKIESSMIYDPSIYSYF